MSFLMRKYDLDDDQLKMLYLIDLMTRGEPVKFVGEDKESFRWVRELAVLIYTYEGVVMGIFDYDYAPAPFKVASKRMYLNISQDGKDDVTDLRERNLVVGLKVTSQTYTNSVVFRLSELGEDCLKECMTDEIRADIDRLFCRADGKPGSKLMPSAVEFDEEEEKFKITTPGGYLEWSTITEIEAVSYVSSPYIPAHLRHFGEEASSNADRIDEMKNAISDIKDEELSENITLDEVLLAVVEWVPMGGNQIVSLNDTLGSSERIQGGFFTAMVDEAPDETQFQGSSEGLTCVNLLDYAEASYANFEAEVYFPAEEGVIQVEMFGMHFSDTGCMIYGLDINTIMDRVRDSISLDLMSRLLVDVHNDSSEVVTPLFTAHQRALLDLTFLGDSENRDKFNVICAERIHPKEKAEFYMDKEDNENELKQVPGDTQSAHDLGEDELIVIGMFGILVAGTDSKRHQPLLQAYAGLKARNIFMKAVSARCYIVADALQQTRVLIDTYYEDPESVDKIRELISECTEHVINLSEIQVFLVESCEALREENVGPIPGDRASEDLAEVLSIPFLLDCTWKRAGDIEKTIDGCRNDLTALREMSNSISEVRNQTTDEKLEVNTKNLEDISRASARNDAASFEILNVIFAGSIAFQILDRVFGTYMGVADQIGWVEDYIRPYTINVPMIWFIINMVVWVGFGAFVIGLLRYKGYMANAAEAVTTTLALPVDMDKLRKFLKGKPITSEEITQDEKSLIKKYQWDEEDPKRWNGEPPRFELKVDERFGFILQIFITIVMRKSKLNCNAALEMILQELQDAGVVQAGVSATQLKVTEDVPPKGGSLPSSPSLSRQQSSVSN